MATQYTSLLGLALPVTGELSGTWGDTVNDSITSLLDTAVAGTTTLSTDIDVTLTTTTGASNQARQAIILWAPASGTVTRNITAPAQSKIYTVINASGGTQSIVFRGAGPTTGVTIVKGESAIVAWNGSDFIKVSNTGGSASFTNVTVTGTTTLSALTASTALALDSSKNVVSVTNTGTGNNVLSASPTLTGTVSGASLQLSSLTSGRVTFAGASGLLSDAAGLTWDGTTLTANALTLTNRLAIASGGTNATATPTAGAIAYGTGSAYAFSLAGSSGQVLISGGTGAPTWSNLSSIGVTTLSFGTTGLTPSTATSGAITVAGTLATTNGGTGLTSFTANRVFYASSTSAIAQSANLTFDGTTLTANNFTDSSLTSGRVTYATTGGNLTDSANLTFDGTNLGIGGAATSFGAGYAVSQTTGSSGGYSLQSAGAVTSQMAADSGYAGALIGTRSNHPVLFTLNNTEQMRLTSTGLGIGTSSPSQKLDVSGSARVTGSVYSTSFINTTNGTSYFTDASTGNGIYVGGSTATPANAVRVFTNAAEVARFDSSGNLGLGVAPSAWGSLYKALQNAAGFYGNYSTTNIIVGQNWYDAAAGSYRYVNNGHATYYTQVSGTHSWHTAPSGTAGNAISFTQAMTLDASGRLFVNATSTTETAQLLVSGTKTISSGIPLNQIGVTDATAMAAGVGGAINFIGKYTSGGLETSFASIEASKDNGTSGDFGAAMLFKTRVNGGAQTERARIDSSGNLLVGSASGTGARIYARGGADVLFADATGSNTGYVYRTATNSAQAGYFITSAGQAGYIQCTGNTTSYVSGSDYRLKDNIRPIDGALAKVAAMRPVAFEWKSDGSYGESFLAHELAEVCPQAVTGEKDAVDEEGKPVYQGIDTSFLVATLTAALQEAHGLIKDQSAAITALTARVAALESN